MRVSGAEPMRGEYVCRWSQPEGVWQLPVGEYAPVHADLG